MKTSHSPAAKFVLAAFCTIGFSSVIPAAAAANAAGRIVPGHAAIAPLSLPTVDISGETCPGDANLCSVYRKQVELASASSSGYGGVLVF